MGSLKALFGGILVVYLAVLLFLVFFQRSFIYFPSKERPNLASFGQAAENYRVVTTTTQDGLTLEGWYNPPAAAHIPVILWFHGNAMDHANRVYWAQHYVQAGYGVLLAGYRGYGGNPGTPTEQGLFKDAHAWVKMVQSELNVSSENLILHGESLGSGVAIEMATHYPARALVLQTPYKSLRALTERQYPIFPIRFVMKDQFDSLSRIANIKMPVLMFHGKADSVIPFSHAKELYDAAPEPKQFIPMEQAEHANVYDYGAGQFILTFLNAIKNSASQ